MIYKDIKDIEVGELRRRRRESLEKLFEMRMKHSLGQLGSPIEIRKVRRQVAQYNTALRSREGLV